MFGRVNWFDSAKGYGFIVCDDGYQAFVHFGGISINGDRTLIAGMEVSLDRYVVEKGFRAYHVVPIDADEQRQYLGTIGFFDPDSGKGYIKRPCRRSVLPFCIDDLTNSEEDEVLRFGVLVRFDITPAEPGKPSHASNLKIIRDRRGQPTIEDSQLFDATD